MRTVTKCFLEPAVKSAHLGVLRSARNGTENGHLSYLTPRRKLPYSCEIFVPF